MFVQTFQIILHIDLKTTLSIPVNISTYQLCFNTKLFGSSLPGEVLQRNRQQHCACACLKVCDVGPAILLSDVISMMIEKLKSHRSANSRTPHHLCKHPFSSLDGTLSKVHSLDIYRHCDNHNGCACLCSLGRTNNKQDFFYLY